MGSPPPIVWRTRTDPLKPAHELYPLFVGATLPHGQTRPATAGVQSVEPARRIGQDRLGASSAAERGRVGAAGDLTRAEAGALLSRASSTVVATNGCSRRTAPEYDPDG